MRGPLTRSAEGRRLDAVDTDVGRGEEEGQLILRDRGERERFWTRLDVPKARPPAARRGCWWKAGGRQVWVRLSDESPKLS